MMKVTVAKEELQSKLSDIQNIVDKRNTMPILNHFLLTAKGQESSITATDLETAFKEPISLKIAEEGRMCIPAKKLFEIVREIDGEITLESVDAQWVRVKAGASHFRLACLSDSEFPVWPGLGDAEQIEIPARVLREMIEKTLYAAGESDTRYVLNGLLFHFKEVGSLIVVGTDGHRLALVEKTVAAGFKEERKVIISRKAIAELRRFLHSGDDAVRINLGKNHVLFAAGEVEFLTRMIEGTYPNYEQVLPMGNDKTLTADCEALARALKRVSIMSKERSNAVRVDLEAKNMIVSASNPDLGEAKDEVGIAFSGDPMSIAFNARYLLDAINAMEGETVVVKLKEALNAVMLLEQDRDDYKCVVMPMRV